MGDQRNERDLTQPQREALKWLNDHNGDGMFDRNGVLLAAGESAPHTRATWNRLQNLGMVDIYKPIGTGRGRCRLTENGRRVAQTVAVSTLPYVDDDDIVVFPGSAA